MTGVWNKGARCSPRVDLAPMKKGCMARMWLEGRDKSCNGGLRIPATPALLSGLPVDITADISGAVGIVSRVPINCCLMWYR